MTSIDSIRAACERALKQHGTDDDERRLAHDIEEAIEFAQRQSPNELDAPAITHVLTTVLGLLIKNNATPGRNFFIIAQLMETLVEIQLIKE